jgi:hypothetical protein
MVSQTVLLLWAFKDTWLEADRRRMSGIRHWQSDIGRYGREEWRETHDLRNMFGCQEWGFHGKVES